MIESVPSRLHHSLKTLKKTKVSKWGVYDGQCSVFACHYIYNSRATSSNYHSVLSTSTMNVCYVIDEILVYQPTMDKHFLN